jgi:hypothetical protein
VVQRLSDRRKEAGALRLKFARLQRQYRAVEPVVRPEIVLGHAPQMGKLIHGQASGSREK